MAFDIRPLTPNLRGAFFDFFDHAAFADNPQWKGCYCAFAHHDHGAGTWRGPLAAENRALADKLVCTGRMQGYIAFDGAKPAGWCQAAPRTGFLALQGESDPDGQAPRTGAIVCFVVAKPYRGQGLAKALLDAACSGFRAQGLAFAEAYPRKNAASEAANHFGPLAMYRAFGFEEHWQDADSICMRMAL